MSNPFEQEDSAASYPPPASSAAPAVNPFSAPAASSSSSSSSSYTPPAANTTTFSSGGGAGGADLARKEAELARRAAELDEKERMLKKREQELGAVGWKPPNWPVCKPMIYHSIAEDIPTELKSMVRAGYYQWIMYASTLAFNFFSVMCYYFAYRIEKPGGFIASIFLMVLGAPLSFQMSYQSLYNGAAKGKSSPLIWYVFTNFCTFAVCVFGFVGYRDTGVAGMLLLVDASKEDSGFITAIVGITMALWGILICFTLYTSRRVWNYYRVSGGSGKAEEETRAALQKQAAKQAVSGSA